TAAPVPPVPPPAETAPLDTSPPPSEPVAPPEPPGETDGDALGTDAGSDADADITVPGTVGAAVLLASAAGTVVVGYRRRGNAGGTAKMGPKPAAGG
ncbi:MAG: hypothetical protein ACRDY5_09315, partial [Acidimicrobiales bacterium]